MRVKLQNLFNGLCKCVYGKFDLAKNKLLFLYYLFKKKHLKTWWKIFPSPEDIGFIPILNL